jgi:hypothetical protein
VSEQDIVDGISIAAEFIKAIEQLISERNKWNRCQSQRGKYLFPAWEFIFFRY